MFNPANLPDGLYTELVTPFRGGALDRVGLMSLIEWQIRGGVAGICVCGAAGETSTLTHEERMDVIRIAVEVAGSEVPVLVVTGTNCTRTTVEFTQEACALGARAAVIVAPYYSKPTQEGVLRHFQVISEAVDIPLVIANAPLRTAIDVCQGLVEWLSGLPNVVGLIDYTGDLARRGTFPVACGRSPRHYSGHELTALPFCLLGGRGAFSVAANVAPRLLTSMFHAQQSGNIPAALELNRRLLPLVQALEQEHSVAAAKLALSCLLGLSPEVRLPLTPVEPSTEEAIRGALALLGDHRRTRAARA
jgi:4-hydroxy-tetrahydrodipicolinate synthase